MATDHHVTLHCQYTAHILKGKQKRKLKVIFCFVLNKLNALQYVVILERESGLAKLDTFGHCIVHCTVLVLKYLVSLI